MAKTIAVVEDHEDILQLIDFHLKNQGYNTVTANNGVNGFNAILQAKPDLCLLDIMLPDLSGIDLCKKIKSSSELSDLPIVFLTAKTEEADVLDGLEAGADDYIAKPFSPKVMLARVKAVLRRTSGAEEFDDSELTSIGPIAIHQGKHEVRINGETLKLTPSEFEILLLLSNKPGWVFSRNQIVDSIHGQGYAVTDRSIDFQMVGLRKKLGDHGHFIETVRGVGYRFKEVT